MTLLFDPRDPSMLASPYPSYQRLRETEPVHQTPFGYWVLSSYDAVDALVRSPSVSSEFHRDPTWARHRGGQDSPIVGSTSEWMLMLDGDAHRRIRKLVNHVFTVPAVERLRPRIATVITELLDAADRDGGEVDLLQRLALPLPVTVICELLGLPITDRVRCREWTDAIGRVVDPALKEETQIAMNKATEEFSEYIAEQLEIRRENPGEDVLSLLITAEVDGERLTDSEIVANVLLLFNAGHETTVNLIGNGLLALLRHPDQLRLLRERPDLITTGIDEIARYDPPVQLAARITTADVAVQGTTIPAGSKVMVLFGAANRDPAKYADPDRLDLTRSGIRALTFGAGPHYCIGAMLGKVEASMVFTELLRRYHTIELATEELTWRPHFNFRGLNELPLKLIS